MILLLMPMLSRQSCRDKRVISRRRDAATMPLAILNMLMPAASAPRQCAAAQPGGAEIAVDMPPRVDAMPPRRHAAICYDAFLSGATI